MIIYGTSAARHLRTAPLPAGTACPGCGQAGGLRSSIFTRYAHLYWIPFFPYEKPAVTECTHCQQTWTDKDLPAAVRAPVLALKRASKAPRGHYSGLGLVLLAGLAGVFFSAKDERANKAYLQSPRAGDIYTVTVRLDSAGANGRQSYSLLKVRGVSGNSVELVDNEYQIDNSHPLDELNKPENYGHEPVYLTRYDLQLMQQKGELTDVDRP